MVDNFDFYPHRCTIYRGNEINPETGIAMPVVIYEDLECYVEQGSTSFLGSRLEGSNDIHLSDPSLKILPGDTIDVTLENGIHYVAKIKQAYPVNDEDFGGQDLKLIELDSHEGESDEPQP